MAKHTFTISQRVYYRVVVEAPTRERAKLDLAALFESDDEPPDMYECDNGSYEIEED